MYSKTFGSLLLIFFLPFIAVDPQIGARDTDNAGDCATAAGFLKTLAMQDDDGAQAF